jgi:hypothetical protein
MITGAFSFATLLQSVDSDGASTHDVVCNHALSQSGGLWTISGNLSDGNIQGPDELGYIDRADTFAKVVPVIGYCGFYGPNISGCTNQGFKNSIILADLGFNSGLNPSGVNLVHEYGHAVGLGHNTDSNNFLNAAVAGTNTWVHSDQCSAMQTIAVDFDGPGTCVCTLTGVIPDTLNVAAVPIAELANTSYLHGFPSNVEDFYGPTDLATLKMILAAGYDAEHATNVVTLIGRLSSGDDDDARNLVDFIHAHGQSSAAHSAVMSLGYIAERGSKLAIQALEQQVKDTDSPLAKSAIGGLAIAGTDDALTILQAISPTVSYVETDAAQASRGPAKPVGGDAHHGLTVSAGTLAEAVRANRLIASQGRRAYLEGTAH